MYADDILLLSASLVTLQSMLSIRSEYGRKHNIIFNCKKSMCMAVGSKWKTAISPMLLDDVPIPWIKSIKYLGIVLVAGISLHVDCGYIKRQEAQLSPSDRAMRLDSSILANYHATVQKLLIRQVLTKPMVWSWRFSRRQCVMNNVSGVINKPTTVELCISPVYRRLAVAKFSKSTMWKLLTWPWSRPLREHSLITKLRLHMADACTKCEVSSVGRCGDITSGIKF